MSKLGDLEAQMTRESCVDPECGRQIFRWAMSCPLEENPSSPVLAKHVEDCAYCRAGVKVFRFKAIAARRIEEAKQIVEAGHAEDPRILFKELGSMRAYFRPGADILKGTLVLTDSEDNILRVDDSTRVEFQELRHPESLR